MKKKTCRSTDLCLFSHKYINVSIHRQLKISGVSIKRQGIFEVTGMAFSEIEDRRVKPEKYGEKKKQKQFMMTDTASRMLNQIARERGITRSEAIEQLVREEIARREKLPA